MLRAANVNFKHYSFTATLALTQLHSYMIGQAVVLTQEEFRAIMLPGRGLRAKLPPPHAGILHTPRVPKGVVR